MLWLIVTLTLVGLALLAAEVILPGLIAGAIGGLLLLIAVWMSFAEYGAQAGLFMLVGILVVTFTGFLLWLYLFPRTFIGKRLMLDAKIDGVGGHPTFTELIGQDGVALTDLRPSGAARFGDRRIDVVAESGYISAQDAVTVRKVEGARVVVRKTTPPPTIPKFEIPRT